MELDDLKKQWKSTNIESSGDAIRAAIEKKISRLERSGRGIRTAFWIEIGFSILLYVLFGFTLWRFGTYMPTYMYKVVILITVTTAPIVWRLYKSQRWINSMDYSKDVRTNMVAFLQYYKRTLWMYTYGVYAVTLVSLVILFTDPTFIALSLQMKLSIIGYLLVICLIARPYVRFAYGKKISVFEDFLKD